MVEEAQTNHNFGERPYYGFEHVTMVGISRRMTPRLLLTDPNLGSDVQETHRRRSPYPRRGKMAQWLPRRSLREDQGVLRKRQFGIEMVRTGNSTDLMYIHVIYIAF